MMMQESVFQNKSILYPILTMSNSSQEVELVRKQRLTETQKWAIVVAYNYFCNPETNRVVSHGGTILENHLNISFRQIQRIVKEQRSNQGGYCFPQFGTKAKA
jgi:hypothetical protein